ncbi:MAG: hypothetical protein EOO01_00170 [Chitinophagaceae bacterium]|nr:MAG: hypothetical protein EOO01_00170 [Chitinophagaceae bacterium]
METLLKKTSGIFTKQLLIDLIGYAYVLLFLYAAIYKLMGFDLFTRQLAKSPLVGNNDQLLAVVIPAVELMIAGMLCYSLWQRIGLYLATVTMAVFAGYIAYVLLFAPNVPCACGGIFVSMGWMEHLLFNIGFMLAGILAIVLAERSSNKSHYMH